MRKYILKRCLLAVLVIWGVSFITFMVSHVVPGDPARRWAGPRAKQEQIEAATKELGLDKPLLVQYIRYTKNLVTGNLGVSIRTKQKVGDELIMRYSATVELLAVSMALSLLIGIPMGVISATKKDSLIDHISRIISISGVAVPVFWLGMLFQLIFFGKFQLLPLQGRISSDIITNHPLDIITGFYLLDSLITANFHAFWSSLKHIILPAITLSYATLAEITRISRSCMLEALSEDHINTSKAFGVSPKVIHFKYALKNALIPTITVIGLGVGMLLGGTFLVETIFDWPGLGAFAVFSILTKDFPSIMGVTVFYAATFVIITLIIDLAYFVIDPRIKSPGAQ